MTIASWEGQPAFQVLLRFAILYSSMVGKSVAFQILPPWGLDPVDGEFVVGNPCKIAHRMLHQVSVFPKLEMRPPQKKRKNRETAKKVGTY